MFVLLKKTFFCFFVFFLAINEKFHFFLLKKNVFFSLSIHMTFFFYSTFYEIYEIATNKLIRNLNSIWILILYQMKLYPYIYIFLK